MEHCRHSGPDRPHGRGHRIQHRPRLRDCRRARGEGRTRRACRPQCGQGPCRRSAHRRRDPRRQRLGPGTRSHVARLRARRRRSASVQPRHHRPADQQRGCDDDSEGDNQGRLRIAVRHKPFGTLCVHRPAARSRARRARVARRHGQQRRTPLRAQRYSLRRPAVGQGLQSRRSVRTGQAGQLDVHLRTAEAASVSSLGTGTTPSQLQHTPAARGQS